MQMAFPGSGSKRAKIEFKRTMTRANLGVQPTPIKDYIDFKKMGGNEILLNLENYENLANSELINGLLQLGKRDSKKVHNWNTHSITFLCINHLR